MKLCRDSPNLVEKISGTYERTTLLSLYKITPPCELLHNGNYVSHYEMQ